MPSTMRHRSARRGVNPLLKSIVKGLALQSALTGKKVNTPYVGANGKSLAVWPLGSSAKYHPPTTSYPYGMLGKYPVIEYKRSGRKPHRKMFPGGQPPRHLYEPVLYHAPRAPRRAGLERLEPIPVPKITARNVLALANEGYVFPKSVLKQAAAGAPITANYKIPEWAKGPSRSMHETRAKHMALTAPQAVNRVGKPRPPLALPSGVQNKLQKMESRARMMAAKSTAKIVTAPWKIAAKARNVTGYVMSLPFRAGRSLVAGTQSVRRIAGRAARSARRLPN